MTLQSNLLRFGPIRRVSIPNQISSSWLSRWLWALNIYNELASFTRLHLIADGSLNLLETQNGQGFGTLKVPFERHSADMDFKLRSVSNQSPPVSHV